MVGCLPNGPWQPVRVVVAAAALTLLLFGGVFLLRGPITAPDPVATVPPATTLPPATMPKATTPTITTPAAATLIGAAVPASAKDAEANTAKVKLETHKTPAVIQGGATWIVINWRRADADATGFRNTAASKTDGVAISYPQNAGDHSSLMANDTLSSDEVDLTALRLDVPYGSKQIKLDLVAAWNDGKKDIEKKFTVTVPTFAYTGEDVALVTTDAGVVAADNPWVDVDWSGLAPSLDGVQMTADGPPCAVVSYPGERGRGRVCRSMTG